MALKRRAVVVGLGSIGRRHARLLQERSDLFVELCEPAEDVIQLARSELGDLVVHRSYEEALASRPDIVVIATPHQMHADQTCRALEQGIHVLCEKPMSDSLADARRMHAAAARTQAVLSIAFMLHFHLGIVRLRKLIQESTLGTILQVHYRVGSYITLVNSVSRYQSSLEGALLLDYAHQADIVYWLLGKRPKGVYMVARQGGNLEFTSNPNVLTMVCDYDRPLLTTIELNYLQMPQRNVCEIVGDAGWAILDGEKGLLRIGMRETNEEVEEALSIERDDMYRLEHAAFLDALDGRGLPSSPAAEAIVSMEIIDAALTSWRRGERVSLGCSERRTHARPLGCGNRS